MIFEYFYNTNKKINLIKSITRINNLVSGTSTLNFAHKIAMCMKMIVYVFIF